MYSILMIFVQTYILCDYLQYSYHNLSKNVFYMIMFSVLTTFVHNFIVSDYVQYFDQFYPHFFLCDYEQYADHFCS